MSGFRKDITRKNFGRWTVISFSHNGKDKSPYWLCLCSCGTSKIIRGQSLKAGASKSCGCLRDEIIIKMKVSHGMRWSSIYQKWCSMIYRCTNPNSSAFKNYGGRGIAVCKSWLKFENFYRDMGDCPKGLTLERIDNNIGYIKHNCKWATRKEQQNNRRCSTLISFNGKTLTLTQWAEELGIHRQTLYDRINRSLWPIEKALNKGVKC